MQRHSTLLMIASLFLVNGCSCAVGNEIKAAPESADLTDETEITAEIWVDNWFDLTVNGIHIMSDSSPYNTERSFNSDRTTFTATLPATIAMEFRDFMENDTGLEYIGSRRQQMGDGGAIAQFRNKNTGDILKFTDASWKCKTIHHAPINPECAYEQNPKPGVGLCQANISTAPTDWTSPRFDDTEWPFATEFSANTVRPKRDYYDFEWNPNAKFIWSNDLELDNIILCRAVIK